MIADKEMVCTINEYLAKERNPSILEDLMDGKVYRDFVSLGLLGGTNQISITVSIDGVSPFKDSDITLWPLWLVINELPPQIRFKNVYFVGLYYGLKKPSEEILLKPLVDELIELQSGALINGIKYTVVLLSLIADLQAKSLLLKLKGPTGFFSCANCNIKGVTHPTGKNRVFIGYAALRDKETWVANGQNRLQGIDGNFHLTLMLRYH
jgi:hypothetical protein